MATTRAVGLEPPPPDEATVGDLAIPQVVDDGRVPGVLPPNEPRRPNDGRRGEWSAVPPGRRSYRHEASSRTSNRSNLSERHSLERVTRRGVGSGGIWEVTSTYPVDLTESGVEYGTELRLQSVNSARGRCRSGRPQPRGSPDTTSSSGRPVTEASMRFAHAFAPGSGRGLDGASALTESFPCRGARTDRIPAQHV